MLFVTREQRGLYLPEIAFHLPTRTEHRYPPTRRARRTKPCPLQSSAEDDGKVPSETSRFFICLTVKEAQRAPSLSSIQIKRLPATHRLLTARRPFCTLKFQMCVHMFRGNTSGQISFFFFLLVVGVEPGEEMSTRDLSFIFHLFHLFMINMNKQGHCQTERTRSLIHQGGGSRIVRLCNCVCLTVVGCVRL